MSFVNKRILILTLLVLSITITHTYAHGGMSDEAGGMGETGGAKAPASSDSTNEKNHDNLAKGNISLGFGLVVMAALVSALGSITPFLDLLFPHIPFLAHVKITESKGFLAGSLSFSSGILLFLTLGDLFPGAAASFRNSKLFDQKYSNLVAASIFIFTSLSIITIKFLTKKFRKTDRNQNESPENDDYEKYSAESDAELLKRKDAKKFKSLAIQVAVALAIHNFPEGLALFATTIANERTGVLFGIALALHKLPEGFIISLPIYYATGSRLIAFIIAAVIGIVSQLLGAILGYILFVTVWNDSVSGVIFSVVTACLLYAILHGMLPMAHSYDPNDKYVTVYTFCGLIFFAIVDSIFTVVQSTH